MATGFVWHERMMWHDIGPSIGIVPVRGRYPTGMHPESPETKRRMKNLMDGYGVTDLLHPIRFGPASDDDLTLVHSADYVAKVKELSGAQGGDAGEFAMVPPGSHEIACLGPGAAMAAARAVAKGEVENAYVLARPPGHHAEPERGRGFCIYSNAAIAIRQLQAEGLAKRVAVVDWDVHHGNGTEAAFYADPSVLTISLHEDRLYPMETGMAEARGDGAGEGFNINLPLPPGCGGAAYLRAMDELVLPALQAFRPDIIFIACGYDAGYFDPMGHMLLGSQHFRQMTQQVKDAADRLCGGRLVLTHEGGYSDSQVPFCGVAVLEALMGRKTEVRDPTELLVAASPGEEFYPHQKQAIEAVAGPALALLDRALSREAAAQV